MNLDFMNTSFYITIVIGTILALVVIETVFSLIEKHKSKKKKIDFKKFL